jgi:hypothetical protein
MSKQFLKLEILKIGNVTSCDVVLGFEFQHCLGLFPWLKAGFELLDGGTIASNEGGKAQQALKLAGRAG